MKNTNSKSKKQPAEGDFKEYLLSKLKDPKEAREYLREAYGRSLEDGNGAVFQLALRDVAEAHGGIGWLAKKSGMPRESVYRVLAKERDPKFGSILKVLKPFGFNPFEQRKVARAH
ncbi:MAG TPA: transcriptional regulator [bacterium]|nr:transcriptional regulator [bacterium]